MASMTEGYKVGQLIGLPVIIKFGKPDNVVNVQLLANIGFCLAAMLTGVIVSFPGKTALSGPIAAIVTAIVTAFPVSMICTSVPFIGAIGRAESKPSCTFKGSGDSNRFAAVFAGKCKDRFCGWARETCSAVFTSGLVAILRAKRVFCPVLLERLTGKGFVAIEAFVGSIDLLLLPPENIGAFTATGGLSTPLEALGVC